MHLCEEANKTSVMFVRVKSSLVLGCFYVVVPFVTVV